MTVYNKHDIEILVSTMNKKSLDFLIPMFPFSHFSHFSILVVNQTQKELLLNSDYPTVRVVNSFEKGLSRSRNLAINNTKKRIAIIADDDVIYYPNFEADIIKAFNTHHDASIITFNHQRIGKKKPQKKTKIPYLHSLKSIWTVSSIEIAFKIVDIKKSKTKFNEYFGLGAVFQTAEEYLFLRLGFKNHLKIYFSPNVIVSHPLLSSGMREGDNDLLFARSALFYKIRGQLVYLWLLRYLWFLFRNKYIQKEEIIQKFKVGLSGVNKFIEIEKRHPTSY